MNVSKILETAKTTARSVTPASNNSAVIDGIMLWISVAIMMVVFLPVLYAVLSATPAIPANATLNATQRGVTIMVGNSYGLLIVVLIILAAVILLGVIAYLRSGAKQ